MSKGCTKKQTPKKITDQLFKKNASLINNQAQAELQNQLLPLFDVVPSITLATPLKKQPQFLSSPSPIKKDLFHQLLGTQTKQGSPYNYHVNPSILEEVDDEMFESSFADEEAFSSNSALQDDSNDGENGYDSQNVIKKRKRKSTNQIKMLKAQLSGQMNWSKQKIIKMAQVTGLSQSQVYKWCWDQKKKQAGHRHRHENKYSQLTRRKLIQKSFNNRQKFQQDEKNYKDQNQYNFEIKHQTKIKSSTILTEAENITTQKKLNKRLVFY